MKKFFITLMCIVMVVCFMPIVAMAEVSEDAVAKIVGEEGYSTLQNAVDNGDNKEIILLKSVEENIVISEGKTITIDLNGQKITNKTDATIVNNGTLTILDSSSQTGTVDNVTPGKAPFINNGTANLKGGTFIRSKEVKSTNDYYNILNHGTLNIESGVKVESSISRYSSLIANG